MKQWRVAQFLMLVALCLPLPAQSLSASETYRLAYDQGNSDGYAEGQKDGRQGHLYDFANKKMYQMADHGFDPAKHDRDIYRVAYRRGFEDGYEQGYGLVESGGPAGPSPLTPSQPSLRSPGTNSSASSGERRTLPEGTRIRIRLLNTLSTQRNERGDHFRAEVAEDVYAGQELLVPEGTRINGTIASLKRAGRIKGRAQMNLRFEELVFEDGSVVPLEARVVSVDERRGQKVKNGEGTIQAKGTKGGDLKKIGASSALGALLGVLTGSARTGATIGAVAGLAGVLTSRGRDLIFISRTEMVIRLERDIQVPAPFSTSSQP